MVDDFLRPWEALFVRNARFGHELAFDGCDVVGIHMFCGVDAESAYAVFP